MTDEALSTFAETIGTDDPVAAEGGRSRWDLGGAPAAETRFVAAPSGIVVHRPDEMTVTVRAGTTVAELETTLALTGQRTALPSRSGSTVGGALAVGESGIDRLGRGHVRDALLQARYVGADGALVTAGGPTVKNVSGFDLCRLLVGSLGTIGLIGEVILRTQPLTERDTWVSASRVDPALVWSATTIAHSILWDGQSTWVHLCGYSNDVAAQLSTLNRLGDFRESTPPDLPPHRHSLQPSALCTYSDPSFVAEIGVGVVHASQPPPKRSISAGVLELNRRIKHEFDPSGRLNPGRDVTAIST